MVVKGIIISVLLGGIVVKLVHAMAEDVGTDDIKNIKKIIPNLVTLFVMLCCLPV